MVGSFYGALEGSIPNSRPFHIERGIVHKTRKMSKSAHDFMLSQVWLAAACFLLHVMV